MVQREKNGVVVVVVLEGWPASVLVRLLFAPKVLSNAEWRKDNGKKKKKGQVYDMATRTQRRISQLREDDWSRKSAFDCLEMIDDYCKIDLF